MFIDRYNNGISIADKVYKAVNKDEISYEIVVTDGARRLDHYAHEAYNESMNWWIIAAASGIGWWLQVPAGIVLKIPTDLNEIKALKR